MCRFFLLIFFSSLFVPLAGTNAQESEGSAEILPVTPSETGEDYLRAIRLRGINPEVTFYSPSGPAPELDTRQQPEKPADQTSTSSGETSLEARWIFGLIAVTLLALILFLFIRFGAGMSITFKGDAKNPDSQRKSPKGLGEAPVWAERLGSLDEILRMRDRRQALVLLARKALTSTVAANGVLMQRSWTARDALRHIPEKQGHLDSLRALVLSSERVQFGGRDVSEDEFRAHVDSCKPLLAGAS